MKCPRCRHEISTLIADTIRVLDGQCPSSCDDAVVISVRCPNCLFKVFGKTVAQDYATWALDEYPEWVEVGSTRELKDPSSLDEDLYIFMQDEKLYLAERKRIIHSGDAEDGLPDLPDSSDLELEVLRDGRWFLWQPARVIAEITKPQSP